MPGADPASGEVLAEMTAVELARRLGTDEEPLLLDVRQPNEVQAWAIPGSVNIPLGELGSRLDEIPESGELVVVCASGSRSRRATGYLTRSGFRATNLTGGMTAWGQVYDTAVSEVTGGRIVQVRRRGKGCLSYLVGAGSESFVVDPSIRTDVYVSLANQLGWRITRVFDTHLHADHLSGARSLARATGASLHLSPFDAFDFDYLPLQQGDRFVLPGGLELSVDVLHTPGHTQGSVVFVVAREAIVSGDTLFVDGVGRPDLAERAEEFARNLHRSLSEKILVLPDQARVLPAHYGETVRVVPGRPVAATLAELRGTLPALSLDQEAFVAWAAARVTERPPHYRDIIGANMGHAPAEPGVLESLEAGPNRCAV